MIIEAAGNGASVVALGEMFNCPYENQFFTRFAEEIPGGETFEMLSTCAREKGIYLIGGSIPERYGNFIYNTSPVFSPSGKLIARHRKMHLFDVELESGVIFKESDTLGRGYSSTVFQTEFGKIGTAICYDIRFPELARLMVLEGAELIVVPAAFNMTTGPAHWELLFRTRAVDNQVFLAGASPARDESGGYTAYGNSLVADPWGTVICRAGKDEEIIYADLDGGLIDSVRRQLPLLKHRRTDIYDVIVK
jgi:predicted amidohydrolase